MARKSKRRAHESNDDPEEDEQVMEEEEEQQSPERKQRKQSRSKKSKRVKVMSESGQTDTDRRKLRYQQRNLAKQIQKGSELSEQLADASTGALEEIRTENNELWRNVKYTREAVLDGDVIQEISTRAARQVDKLINVPRYDATKFIKNLRKKISLPNKTLDWHSFGLEVGSCFNAVPSRVSFLTGPLDSEYKPKERKKPVRRKQTDDDAKEEEVGEVKQTSKPKDGDKLSAVEKHMKTMTKTLKKRCTQATQEAIEEMVEMEGISIEDMDQETKKRCAKKAKHAERPCAVQFLFNPESFTQTVENVFSLSFLIKKGSAEVGVRSLEQCRSNGLSGCTPGPYVVHKSHPEGAPVPKAKQAIVALNMKDWRAMAEAYKVEKGDIPHRTGSKHARPSSRRSSVTKSQS